MKKYAIYVDECFIEYVRAHLPQPWSKEGFVCQWAKDRLISPKGIKIKETK